MRKSLLKVENKKAAVGLSGGVDSSVAALLLKEQGYDVTGVFMQCWDAKVDGCRADEDRADAVAVAAKLGIKFVSLDFIKEYKAKVIEYFYNEYEAGRTPNPDVMCNREIKFGLFLNWALENGFDFVATGHYARVQEEGGKYKLLKGVDESKDQSYFLYVLGQRELARTLFLIGHLKKSKVRKIAENAGLHTFSKPDSVGICFIGEVSIREFLKGKVKAVAGKVVNTAGEVLGEHDGLPFYTIGQRHGFKVTKYVGLPLYVVGKNVDKNELVVGFAGEAVTGEFCVGELAWILGPAPVLPFEARVRIRHLGELYKCTVENVPPTQNSTSSKMEHVAKSDTTPFQLKVSCEDKIFGVAPGQSAVFYIGDEALGGGVIC